MECQRCGNQDLRYMLKRNNSMICRKCIMFGSLDMERSISFQESMDAEYKLLFSLTQEQIKKSQELLKLSLRGDVLVYAACGTGKTEIIMETIRYYLEEGKKVVIAIPRRQVVLEIAKRMSLAFKALTVVPVCGGYTEVIDGDLIVCTTHQLYRYVNSVDMLIIDEPDAYPYKGNHMLEQFAKRAVKGSTLYLTATPDHELLKLPQVHLFKRFHGYPLMVPELVVHFRPILFLKLRRWLKDHKRTLIFVPSKKVAKILGKILKCDYITSETEDKEKIVNRFNQNDLNLITTTILERGVTFINVNVVVLYADHMSFDLASLIQICGRVGRSLEYPTGDGMFLCRKQSRKVQECMKRLHEMNA